MGKATGPLYVVAFRRRRKGLTNYSKRLGLIRSPLARLVARQSLKGIVVQFVKFDEKGDQVISCAHSSELEKYGWLPQANTPTAFLCGLLAAKRAKAAGISESHLDIGMGTPSSGRILFAAAYGAKQAGVSISISDGLVGKSRLDGSHISEYAKLMKASNEEKFRKHFSRYMAKNIDVLALPKIFEAAKSKILSG